MIKNMPLALYCTFILHSLKIYVFVCPFLYYAMRNFIAYASFLVLLGDVT